MGGATGIHDIGTRVLTAFEAGVDLIMLAWNKRQQAQAPAR